MSSGGGSGAVREVTLVVRVQGPQGVGGPSGIGGGPRRAPATQRGIPGGGTPAATGIPTAAGPMPAFGSSSETGGTAMGYGIPGGARGGSYFYPSGNPFRSRSTPEAPARRRPDPSPTFSQISSIAGGGGGSRFGSRSGMQGSLYAANKMVDAMGKIKKTTDDWVNTLGKGTLEFIRLTTWSRPITMGTWMLAEAQAKYGIPLVSGTALAGMGIAGGLAGTALLDKFNTGGEGLRAMRTQAGRAGFMDRIVNNFSMRGPLDSIGPRENALIAAENNAAVQGLRDQQQRGTQFRQLGGQQFAANNAARFSGAAYQNQAMFSLGMIPFDQYWSTFQGQWRGIASTRRTLQEKEAKLVSQLGGGNRSGRRTLTAADIDTGPLGVGSLPSFAGYTSRASRLQNIVAGYGSVNQQMARANTRFGDQMNALDLVRGNINQTYQQQAALGPIGMQQFGNYITQRRSSMQQGINDREQNIRAAQENLSRVQGMQANLTFTLAGYSPFEVKSAIKRYKQIEAGQVPVPRADQLSGALGAMILQGAPAKVQQFERMYRQQQGIGEAIALTGFGGAVGDAQAAADKAEKDLATFIETQSKQIKELETEFTEFLKNVSIAIKKAKTIEAEELATAIAQAIEQARQDQN